MATTSKSMLDGYKVLDFTQVLARPTTTRYSAEMGAEVVRVEIAPNGDISRGVPYLRDGRSAYYVQQNRGKKSLCLELKNPAAVANYQGTPRSIPRSRCTNSASVSTSFALKIISRSVPEKAPVRCT
jgi:hypothetical protein